MISRGKALQILKEKVKNKNLIKHALAVEAAMGALAQYFGGDVDKWKLAGLMHDADWEVTQNKYERHAKVAASWLRQAGEADKEVLDTIASHNFQNNGFRKPKSKMEWALYSCDELTGLIVAVALVMPHKSLSSVTVNSVLKKFPTRAFARGVSRDQIKLCDDKLGIKLDDFIKIVLDSMKGISKDLGL